MGAAARLDRGAPSLTGRTLVVTNDFPPRRGGIESFVFSLCEQLAVEGVVVYTARMAGSGEVDGALAYPVIRGRSRLLLPTVGVARDVRRVAREHGCDCVVFGAAAPLGLLAGGLRRAGVHRLVALSHGHEVWWAKTPGAGRLLRRIGDQVDVVTYVSEFCHREIGAGLSAEARARMVRLSPDVDLARFSAGLDGSPWRARWAVGDRPVVLAASRLVARKGHDVLVRAWPRVLRSCPDAVLVIVGDGPCRRRLERAVRRRSLGASVRMEPGVPWQQMPGVYAAADVFALPCRTRRGGLEPEALGIVCLEAAAAGLPVVVGASGGAPETVADGVTGYVVDPRDVEALARTLATLLTSPGEARAMGLRGRQWVAEHFGGAGGDTLRALVHA